ncbi:LysR family transcriptional regulator [Salipiger mucosus]|uniref:Transcriptional regulator, LysR family n=1 Tax=Salipiger mucosus DSM 16094 TaxID=1123237 RepID=S9RR55_9RHOB|nr:LysR family transcriptional regulator [Salipiger mucosus]EPX76469.1 Transcriptional regulator, LysR family [Salipiger mucosus DSM 16094]
MLGDPGRLRELEIFALVAAEGSFSAAARAGGLTPSAVSKTISRLEGRLGARLIVRNTRRLTLTAEGEDLHRRALTILEELHEAECAAGRAQSPEGRVHISTSASYAEHVLYPALGRLLAEHPGLSITVGQTDEVVDLIGAEADIAIRAGPMPSSSLIARRLGASPLIFAAAPAYLARAGRPEDPEALSRHDLIGLSYRRRSVAWPILKDGACMDLSLRPRLLASDGEAARRMALHGLGIARLARFTVEADLSDGRLVALLPEVNTGNCEPFHAIWLGAGGKLPARLRVVLDFLSAQGRVDMPAHDSPSVDSRASARFGTGALASSRRS